MAYRFLHKAYIWHVGTLLLSGGYRYIVLIAQERKVNCFNSYCITTARTTSPIIEVLPIYCGDGIGMLVNFFKLLRTYGTPDLFNYRSFTDILWRWHRNDSLLRYAEPLLLSKCSPFGIEEPHPSGVEAPGFIC